MFKRKGCDLSDVYFIFADNLYEQYLTIDRFRALINFYALLYQRVIIPDAFFINNKHLMSFLQSYEGLLYIENGLVIPSVRDGINSLIEVYEMFEDNGTLILGDREKWELLNIIEKVDLKQAIRWNVNDISTNFTNNIIGNLYSLNIDEKEKKKWEGVVISKHLGNSLTRKKLHHIISQSDFLGSSSKETLSRYIDISYNFNIPHFLQTSAAYPDILMKYSTGIITPEQVFFNNSVSEKQYLIYKEEYIHTSLFNEGILAALNTEQILHIRQQKEYKNLIRVLRKMSESYGDSFSFEEVLFDFVYMFEQELPRIITKEIKENVNKEKRKLKIQSFGRNTLVNDGVNSGMDMTSKAVGLVLEGFQEFVGGKVIGSVLNIMLNPVSRKTEREIKKLDFKGRKIINDIKNEYNIIDNIKSFSLNSLK